MKQRALLTRNPAAPLLNIDRWFDDLITPFWGTQTTEAPEFRPACDLIEAADHYLVTLDLPGTSKDDVSLEIKDNFLVVSGERKQEAQHESANTRFVERVFGRFERAFQLPNDVNLEKIEATHKDGVLKISLPKTEVAKPRQIKID